MKRTKETKKRKITICRKTVTRSDGISKHLPAVTLSGIWLLENGFEIGQVIDITCESGMLVITVSEEQRFEVRKKYS